MNRRLLMGAVAFATIGWGSCEMAGVAHAANCGGQGAAPQPVPYTCTLPGIDITAQGFTRHFSAVINVNGTTVSATFFMTLNGAPAPLPVDVPIRIVHHEGISGAGGLSDQSTGVIPAGQTQGTVVDSVPCREGQVDVKAVFIGNGQSQGRVGGPWIQNGTGCTAVTTTVPQSSTTVPAVPSSTVPPPVATTTPGTTPPVETTAANTPGGGTHSTALPKTALPATGGDNGTAVAVGLGLLVGGLLLITAAVRRRAS